MNKFDIASQTWDVNPVTQKLSAAINAELDKRITFTNKMQVLDYGAGTGLMLFHIQPKVKHISAIDTSEGMRQRIKEKLDMLQISNVSVLSRNIELENLPENTYDVILSSMTMHHIKDTQDFFNKLYYSVSEDGGTIAIVDLVAENGTFHSEPDSSIHHLGFNIDAVKEKMKNAGFLDIVVEPFHEIEKPTGLYPVFIAIGKKE